MVALSLQGGAEDITASGRGRNQAVSIGGSGDKMTTPVFEKEGSYSHDFSAMMKNAKGLEMVLQVHIAKVKAKIVHLKYDDSVSYCHTEVYTTGKASHNLTKSTPSLSCYLC